jgi:hypothetical protein
MKNSVLELGVHPFALITLLISDCSWASVMHTDV